MFSRFCYLLRDIASDGHNSAHKTSSKAKAKAKASQSVEGLLLSSFITEYVQSTDV